MSNVFSKIDFLQNTQILLINYIQNIYLNKINEKVLKNFLISP